MEHASILPRRTGVIAGTLLLIFVFVAVAINVPWAVALMPSKFAPISMISVDMQDVIPTKWPSKTPHAFAWPVPNGWDESRSFGCRSFNVFGGEGRNGQAACQMELLQSGWPFPVLEKKQMWWDWEDPKWAGPEDDPGTSLMWKGLILNPILVGGAAWVVFVILPVLAMTFKRYRRLRRNACMACGYPVGTSPVCTECGVVLAKRLSST